MRSDLITIAAAFFSVGLAAAQTPQPPASNESMRGAIPSRWLAPPDPLPPLSSSQKTPPIATPPQNPQVQTPPVQRFDSASLRLKNVSGKWQLWGGNVLLKDFGASEHEANEALQVFRDLRVDSRGSIGGVFEYWLADGKPPFAFMRHKQVVPFDPRTLRIEQASGQWVLRDAHVVLYNFGRSQTDAQQALAVCKQYQFNQLGYVGHPTPFLKYLMHDPNQRAAGPANDTVVPASALMQANEVNHPRLILHDAGEVADRIPFDGRRLDLRRVSGEWVLYAGQLPFFRFGPAERDGRTTLETLEPFRLTEVCRFGDSGFAFFLSNGRAPQGSVVGTGAKPFRPEMLNVRQIGDKWAVCDGSHPLIDFGDKADDARHALAAIREFKFDYFTQVGNGRLGNVYLFVKTRY
jgi:hypothetical protein